MWFCGFSGGAEFVTALLIPYFGSRLGISGGGMIAFAGGDAPAEYGVTKRALEVPPAEVFACHWVVGEYDIGVYAEDGFDGVKAAIAGSRWYSHRNFNTSLTKIDGLHHILDRGVFGRHVDSALRKTTT